LWVSRIDETGGDMAAGLRWEPTPERRGRPLIFAPPRFTAVLGAVLTIVGTVTPWATGVDERGNAVAFIPLADTDGVLFLMVSIIVPILVLSANVAESRTRTLQVSTGIVGAVAVLSWLEALRLGIPPLVGGSGVHWINQNDVGVFIAGVGVALIAIGGFAISLNAWRHNGTMKDPADVVITGRSLAGGLIQAASAVAGFMIGLYGSLAAFGSMAILVMTLGGLGAGAVGIAVGERISSRFLVPSTRGRPMKAHPVRNRLWTDGGPRF
jgi:hypothetical protein